MNISEKHEWASFELTLFDERLQLGHRHAAFLHQAVLALGHRFLDYACDFLRCLGEHFVHILGHGVALAQVLGSALGRLGVGVQRGLVLLQELLLDSDIMVRDAQHNQPVLWHSCRCLSFCHRLVLILREL